MLRRQGALAGSSLSEEEVAQLAEDAANLMVGSQAGPSKIPLPGSVLGAEATNLTALGATALAHSGVPSVAVTNLAWLCDGFNQVRLVWPALPEPIPASQHALQAFGVDLRKATGPTAEQRAADFFQPPTGNVRSCSMLRLRGLHHVRVEQESHVLSFRSHSVNADMSNTQSML